jgi:hypothetical protein
MEPDEPLISWLLLTSKTYILIHLMLLAECYAPRFHGNFLYKKSPKKISPKKIIQKILFLAIGVSHPIWGMPAKNWGV